MNQLRNALIVLLLSSTTVLADAASDDSIKQLLTVTQAHNLLETMRSQYTSIIKNATQQALKGKEPNAKQQQAIAKMTERMTAVMQEDLSWSKLEPMYIRLYKTTFTEEEVTGMVSFYKTPAGQAVIYKLPALIQKAFHEIQKTATTSTSKTRIIQDDFFAEMEAGRK